MTESKKTKQRKPKEQPEVKLDEGAVKGNAEVKLTPVPVPVQLPSPETPVSTTFDEGDDSVDLPPVLPRFRSPLATMNAAAAINPSTAQMRQQALAAQARIAEDFEATLAGLDFEDGLHTITVHRMEPEFDPVTNKRIAGYVEKYSRLITLEDIRMKHGGGKYRLLIHGQVNGRNGVLRGTKIVEIAGDPIPPPSRQPIQQPQQQGAISPAMSDIIEKAISTQERQTDRLAEENKELKTLIMTTLANNANKGDGGLKETMMLMFSEERKMNEARMAREREEANEMRKLFLGSLNKAEQGPAHVQNILAEERRLQESRMAQEREDRRREQEAAERRHKETLEAMRLQSTQQIEQMKLEQERIRAEAREAMVRNQQQFELQLKQLEKQESQKEQQSLKLTEFMTTLQNQQLSQMQKAQELQITQLQSLTTVERDFMLKQIDLLSKKDNSLDQMLKYKQVMDALTGKGDEGGDGKETWEKIIDRVQDSIPGLVAAAGMIKSTSPSAPQQRVLPGSVAVVEVDDEPRQRRPLPRRKRRPSEPQTVDVVAEPAKPAATGEVVNDLKDFVFPVEGTEVPAALEMLVKDIDLALQKDMEPSEIKAQVLDKFSPSIIALLAEQSSDMVVSVIEAKAPVTWKINSLDGQMKVRAMHSLIASA